MLLVGFGEISPLPGNAFGRAKEKETARPKCIMEDRDQPVLQGGVEINQEIATGNQVQLGEGRIAEHVMNREYA